MVQSRELVRKRVLYIGSAVPLETAEGLDAIQKPLLHRYPVEDDKKIEGIESYLSVVPEGLKLQYASDPGRVLFFPITSLSLCAAVRCVNMTNSATGEKTARFLSLSSPACGGSNSTRPAIFTTITRRTEGRKVLECHAFVCTCAKDALELVHFTSSADQTAKSRINSGLLVPSLPQEGFSMTAQGFESHTMRSVPVTSTVVTTEPEQDHPVRLVAGENHMRKAAPEFYEPPPEHGYFYKTQDSQVKTYTVERLVEGDTERLRAISPNVPTPQPAPQAPLSERAASMRRPVYTGPPPGLVVSQGRTMIPVRGMPPQTTYVRPRFFSPPPPVLRPRPMAVHPGMMGPDPYVFLQRPVPVMDPHFAAKRRSSRRKGSRSSSRSSSASQSPGPQQEMNGPETNGQQAANGEASSDGSSRPHTPPTDYERGQGPRISRREHFDYNQRVVRGLNPGPVPYATLPAAMSPHMAHPYGMYVYQPRFPPYGFPPYMMERARSVPPTMNRKGQGQKSGRKGKKSKKNKKKSKKGRYGAPSDVSTDSVGYTSELAPGGDYPRQPRDFRRFENQFKHERAFSKSLKAEGGQHHVENAGNAYSLNEHMSGRVEAPDFNMY